MKTLGVSMIVKNGEEVLRDCLDSVKGADQIFILDTGSSDKTYDIYKEYNIQWKKYSKWNQRYDAFNDFAGARNESLQRMTTDYVLQMDADEKLATSILKIKQLINEYWFRKYFGAMIVIKTAMEVFEFPRLFRNMKEIYYINAIHNLPSWEGDSNELRKKLYTSAFVIDSGYDPAHKFDPNRTLRILLKEYKKDNRNTRTIYYMAKEYMNKKDIRKAVKLFEKYRGLKYFKCDCWDNELANVLYLLSLCYCDIQVWGEVRWFDAVRTAHEAWSVLPTSSNVAKLLVGLFGEPPGAAAGKQWKQILTYNFWVNILDGVPLKGTGLDGKPITYRSCDETGVLSKMNI